MVKIVDLDQEYFRCVLMPMTSDRVMRVECVLSCQNITFNRVLLEITRFQSLALLLAEMIKDEGGGLRKLVILNKTQLDVKFGNACILLYR